jgi:hypothetical protein
MACRRMTSSEIGYRLPLSHNQTFKNMLSLQNILKVNAISSGVTGLSLVLFSGFFTSLFEVGQVGPFLATGAFLILFAGFVLLTAFQKPMSKEKVILIIWLDRTWVIGSIIAIVLLANQISLIGIVLISGVALWVALMALLQSKGLRLISAY